MRKTESACVDCGFPCNGRACPNYEITRFFCDECGDEEKLFEFDGRELCIRCIEKALKVVEGSE